jgi:hypothetical protein
LDEEPQSYYHKMSTNNLEFDRFVALSCGIAEVDDIKLKKCVQFAISIDIATIKFSSNIWAAT